MRPGAGILPNALAFGLVVFACWLTSDQEVVALVSPHDDQYFLQRAECGYWFDQGYSHMTFIKEPIYPLFGWLCYRLGMPLRLATEAIYLAAAGFFSWSLVRRRSPGWVGLLVLAACALHPMRFAVFRQAISDTLYPTLLLLALGTLFVPAARREPAGPMAAWCIQWSGPGIVVEYQTGMAPGRFIATLLPGLWSLPGLAAESEPGNRVKVWGAEWASRP